MEGKIEGQPAEPVAWYFTAATVEYRCTHRWEVQKISTVRSFVSC